MMAKRATSSRSEKARAEARKRRRKRESAISLAKDVAIAFSIVVIVMLSLWAYSGGIWPPMVVVESESMMHGDDSEVGIIDTGDLTLVKRIESKSDIVTYVEGRPSFQASWTDQFGHHGDEKFKGSQPDFMTYGDYGEVVIYRKNGASTDVDTPVIHRAIVWIEPNWDEACLVGHPDWAIAGNFPDIKNAANPDGLKCVQELTIKNVGYRKEDIVINVERVLTNAFQLEGEFFGGFLSKGDHNAGSKVDQESLESGRLAPIKVGWVVGESVGELPWFGAIKLVFSGTTDSEKIPPSSWNGLIVTIVIIIVVPFALDIIANQVAKRKKRKKQIDHEEAEDEKDEEEEMEDEEDFGEVGGKEKKKRPKDVIEEDLDLDDEFGEEFEDMKT